MGHVNKPFHASSYPYLLKRRKEMKHKLVRIAIGVPEAFIALSAEVVSP